MRMNWRLTIALAMTAPCAPGLAGLAGAADISLGEAFGSLQLSVQTGRTRLDKTRAASDADDVYAAAGLGSWVMDKEDRVGRVVALYPHGFVGYQVGDTGYLSNDLSPELEYGDGVWRGDTVIDPDDEIGAVMHIFCTRNPRGLYDPACRIQYKVGNGLYVAKGGLKREVQEYIQPHSGRKVSRGSTIITPENKVFTADRIFSDGRVAVRIGAKYEVLARDRYTAVQR